MRSAILAIPCLMSALVFGGCATGLRADAGAVPLELPQAPEMVRVRILYTRAPSRLDCQGSWRFGSKDGSKTYASNSSQRVRAMGGKMVIGQKSVRGEVIAMPDQPANSVTLNGRHYRGALVFHPLAGGRYDVVEYVDVEDYLYGVLPREVEPSWPAQSLKAQAVVSRTYALHSKMTAKAERFDVSNSVLDQVYGGQDVEAPETNHAVDDTRGEALVDSTGCPVQAFFHSSCGGHTELPQQVWSASQVADVFEVVSDGKYCQDDPHYKWQLTLSYNTIRERLRHAGIRVRDIRSISVLRKSPSGRAEIFSLQTSRGKVEVWGNRFRLAMGPEALRSTFLTNMKAGKRTVYFEGHGWGHGVGLCQWGARGRALAGQSYKDILSAYYPKAKLSKL